MKHLFYLLIPAMLLASCGETIHGDGNVTSEERSLDQFNAIEVSGMFDIVLVEGEHSITVVADENLHEHIETKVEDGVLIITSNNKMLDAEELELTVFYRELEEVSISGACELQSSGAITGEEFELKISGAAEADIALHVELFTIDLSGGAELEVKGIAERIEFELSGAAEIRAYDLAVEEAEIDISGASEVEISVSDELDVEISGAGEVNYKGDPEISSNISGAGSLNKK